MRLPIAVFFVVVAAIEAEEPKFIIKPDAFPTLVNPNCSHCIDEAKRRKDELKDSDRVLVWTRGKYEGGAIPFRFFLNRYPVISDTYGVFVHDADAGYARGFKASVDFTFHGWRNGVMVMKHKDGTIYSCLSGLAIDGPNKGRRLESWPTLVADWGWVMKYYPKTVAYHMFEKYQPVDLPAKPNEDSLKSRGKPDPRLKAEEMVLGVEAPTGRSNPRAYPLAKLAELGVKNLLIADEFECGQKTVVLWQGATQTAAAFFPEAEKREATPKLGEQGKVLETKPIVLSATGNADGPFVDEKTGSRFDIAGRGVDGELKGWTLKPHEAVVCKWFAWAAEYPSTTIYAEKKAEAPKKAPNSKADDAIKEVAGAAEFLKSVPKKFAKFEGFDSKSGRVKLHIEDDKAATEWPVEPDAEIKFMGWWGRLEQIPHGYRVWVWFKTDRQRKPASVLMLADEISELDIHGDGLKVTGLSKDSIRAEPFKGRERNVSVTTATKQFRGKNLEETTDGPKEGTLIFFQTDGSQGLLVFDREAFEAKRTQQKQWLRERWEKEGLPGTVTFSHVSGEADLMLDHEAMRWARSLKNGDKVKVAAEPPIEAVVKNVGAWRERTQVRIVINGVDLAGLTIGQRIYLKMTPPSAETENGDYPPDIDKPKTKEERIDWFLANIYCVCKVGKDVCTGHFYTLASCNPNSCAGPITARKKLAEKIDAGLSNRQIWDDLKVERGALSLKPHLLP
jgi:hypothetical protein